MEQGGYHSVPWHQDGASSGAENRRRRGRVRGNAAWAQWAIGSSGARARQSERVREPGRPAGCMGERRGEWVGLVVWARSKKRGRSSHPVFKIILEGF